MKKHLLLKFIFLLLLCSPVLKAQFQNGIYTGKQANNWYFGAYGGITFNTSPPTPVESHIAAIDESGNPDVQAESSGSVSDADGNLLFYTNGVTVWNRNHEIMENGEGLIGNISSVQSGLVLPIPGNPNKYYIFTTSSDDSPGYLAYSEVDMSLDGGLGAVTANKNIVLASPYGQKITAVHHADENKIWVVSHLATLEAPGNTFNAYLISENGINTIPVTSSIGDVLHVSWGQMKISPDGSKIAMLNGTNGVDPFFITLQVFDFDNNSGRLTNPVTLSSAVNNTPFDLEQVYGLEFSPNGQFLYATETGFFDYGRLHQFDLNAGSEQDVLNSDVLLSVEIPGGYFALQSAPDGKIYMVEFDSSASRPLSVINYPNNKGAAAGFERARVETGSEFTGIGLPTFIQSYFESGILYHGSNCPMQDVAFSTKRIPDIQSIDWNFGDPSSGADNASTQLEPLHAFTAGGTYTVTAIITSNGAQQTATTTVTILPAPVAVPPQGANLIQCADANGNAVFNLSELNAGILNGQDTAVFSVAYYANEADVTSNTPIAAPDAFTTSGQAVYARVTNTITGCTTTLFFNLTVNPLPVAVVPNALEVCNNSDSASFNLTSQNAAILGVQEAGTFRVNYYATLADAQANTAIANPAAFTSTGQTVYAVVTNTATGCTSALIAFDVVVKQPVIVTDVIATEGCIPFNLTMLDPPQSAGLILSYYTAEQDAITATNAIAQFEAYRFDGEQQTIYIRVEDPLGCASINTLQLQIGNCEIPKGISPNNDGKNDSFDLSGFDVKQLSIYNRYGQQVYSRNNYQSEWHGQADNNNELPTGTYYYSIEQDGGEQKTGWVYINREVR